MLTRHNVAAALAAQRVDADLATDPEWLLDTLAHDLARLLPPGQRDQFLLACGVPR